MTCTHGTELSLNKVVFLCQLIMVIIHDNTGMGWERESDVVKVRTMGIWATCTFLVPSRPAQTQSYICHLYLIIEGCWVCPNLWLGGSTNIQFMMVAEVVWKLSILWLSIHSPLRPNCKTKLFLKRRIVIHGERQGFTSKS